MPARLRAFLARHPLLRDALVWAIPALVFGATLRLLLVSYLPYAFWGADSRSYYSFAHKVITEGYVSLDEKRRYLYPLLMLPVSLLPGAPLRWIAIFQHALGVATLVPLAYVVRKTLVHWRLWIIPVTVLYAGLPITLWYEHELLGENVFFALLVWAFAGWVAWAGEDRPARMHRLFWCFFVPFALFLLTKPSGRFVWPGVVVGLVLIAAWRRLVPREIVALAALVLVTLTVGSKKQGAWLLYTATFPLTQLEAPLHADYKAQIRDLVEPLARNPGVYYLFDDEPFAFLERPGDHPDRPLWQRLGSDEKLKSKIYMDLAIEAIKARPLMFVGFGLQRAVASSNLSSFGVQRFTGEYYRGRSAGRYAEAQRVEKGAVRLAHALPMRGELPTYEEFNHRLDPVPGSWCERVVRTWVGWIGEALDFSTMPRVAKEERRITLARPTLLGCWLVAGALLAFLPRYFRTLGVWTIVAAGYALGVFIVSQTNARYFGPVWPVLVVLLAVPADVLARIVVAAWERK
ncbi:MAG: hypothetical protein WCF18_00470 [Chthoniobacteraceae bacterium]